MIGKSILAAALIAAASTLAFAEAAKKPPTAPVMTGRGDNMAAVAAAKKAAAKKAAKHKKKKMKAKKHKSKKKK